MRCLLCEKISWRFICKSCLDEIIPTPKKHIVQGKLTVFSFYNFDDVENLIRSKYEPFGSHILKTLAVRAFKPFINDLDLIDTAIIPIDDTPQKHFSHTAVLAHNASSRKIPARYGKLRARSKIHYAGQTLAFRKNNPKRFKFVEFKEQNVILLDDLMTTGTTLNEAYEKLEKMGKTVLFAIVLAKAE